MNEYLQKDLSSCDFHVFGRMKEKLSKRRYHLDDEEKAAIQEWLSGIGRDFFAGGEKFVPGLDKFFNEEGWKKGLRMKL